MKGPAAKIYGDDTAARVDKAIKQTIDDRSSHVAELLAKHNDKSIATAERLLEKEITYEKEFMEMVNPEPIQVT